MDGWPEGYPYRYCKGPYCGKDGVPGADANIGDQHGFVAIWTAVQIDVKGSVGWIFCPVPPGP